MQNKTINQEALELAEESLRNIELSEIPLSGVVTKAMRIARLRGDTENLIWLQKEFSGYTSSTSGILPEDWSIGRKTSRHYYQKDAKTNLLKKVMHPESVKRIETEIESAELQLQQSADPSVTVSSQNPSQYVFNPVGNKFERSNLRSAITKWTSVLEGIKASVYKYVLDNYYELKFGNITESIFERTRRKVDTQLAELCPAGIQELVSAYENLSSTKSSDWSNATNSCRRLLQKLADTLYPAKPHDANLEHQLTSDKYKNRLIAFVEENSGSKSSISLFVASITSLAERLDAICSYQSKGVHSDIVKKEAETIIIYTYLLVGDLLNVVNKDNSNKYGQQKEI